MHCVLKKLIVYKWGRGTLLAKLGALVIFHVLPEYIVFEIQNKKRGADVELRNFKKRALRS